MTAFPQRSVTDYALCGVGAVVFVIGVVDDQALVWRVLNLAVGVGLAATAVWRYPQRIVVAPDELIVRSWRRPFVMPRDDLSKVEVVQRKPRGLFRLRLTGRDGVVWSGGPRFNEVEASDLRAALAKAGYPLATVAFPLT